MAGRGHSFRNYPLHIRFLQPAHLDFQKGCKEVPAHMRVSCGPLDELEIYQKKRLTDEDDDEAEGILGPGAFLVAFQCSLLGICYCYIVVSRNRFGVRSRG